MESNWRQRVYSDIGSTFAHWTYPGTVPQNLVYLCARANPRINWDGQLWTHVLKCLDYGSGYQCRFARASSGSNVLDTISSPYSSFLNFPYGFAVQPDHP